MGAMFKSTQDAVNRLVKANTHLTGTDITTALGSGHSCAPTHNGNSVLYYKGASLLSTGSSGLLAVHLTEDADGVWYLIDLHAGSGIFACEFDLIGDSNYGTTVALDGNLYVYPASYKTASNSGK